MAHNDTTYIIFDHDNDMWFYMFMKRWNQAEQIDFDFADAHDLIPRPECAADEQDLKERLRERFRLTTQVMVLVGENTQDLDIFVRWEIQVALDLNIPIIAVNLNGKRRHDPERCPPLMTDQYIVHVPFNAKIIKYAMDHFSQEGRSGTREDFGDLHYREAVYTSLGL